MPIINDTPFNGGTITQALTIAMTGTNVANDNFGDLVVTGEGGNSGQIEAATSASAAHSIMDSNSGLIVASDSGQIQLANTGATVITFLAQRGVKVSIGLNAAPGTANLAPGEMALWFDSTNGASKLMVQAKSANGTLVSGSVALA